MKKTVHIQSSNTNPDQLPLLTKDLGNIIWDLILLTSCSLWRATLDTGTGTIHSIIDNIFIHYILYTHTHIYKIEDSSAKWEVEPMGCSFSHSQGLSHFQLPKRCLILSRSFCTSDNLRSHGIQTEMSALSLCSEGSILFRLWCHEKKLASFCPLDKSYWSNFFACVYL